MADYKIPVITGTELSEGDLLRWNGSNWVNYADSTYSPSSHLHDGDTLQLDGVNSDGGAFSFTTTGLVTFNQPITVDSGATDDILRLITSRDVNNASAIVINHNKGVGSVLDEDTLAITFRSDSDTTVDAIASKIRHVAANVTHATRRGELALLTTSSGNSTPTEKVRIAGGGNVGINTTSPDTKLQVVGDCKFGDDNTNYTSISTTGAITQTGSATATFGSLESTDIKATQHIYFDAVQTATGDGTTTIDWGLGNKFYFTFGTQNDTFTFTAPDGPCNLVLVLKQDGTGSREATWPESVMWPSGTAPTLTTDDSSIDIISFFYDGTNYFGNSSLNFSVPA